MLSWGAKMSLRRGELITAPFTLPGMESSEVTWNLSRHMHQHLGP